MHLRTQGLGAHDLDLELSPLTLVTARNGAGKSSIANAIRIAALGYVPHLGRREQDTAQLMNGREMTVTLTLGDGRVLERKLQRDGKGKLSMSTRCSWLGEATNEEHAAAALTVFGADAQSVAEQLDLRELLALTGPQRAARIEALIQTTSDPATLAQALGRYTLQRLTDVTDERMPDDHTALRPLVQGYDEDGAHTGQYGALVASWPMVKAKLAEGGLAAAAAHINERKRGAATEVRNARQAREELAQRLADIAEPDAEEIARLEERRGELERQIGAARERVTQTEQQAGRIALADQRLTKAKRDAAEAQAARATIEQELAGAPELRARLETLETEIRAAEAGAAPPAMLEERAARDAAEAELQQVEAELSAVVVPAVPSVAAEEAAVARLRDRIAAAATDPWGQVLQRSRQIREEAGRIPKARNISKLADEISALAARSGEDVTALEAEVSQAEQVLRSARAAAEEATTQAAAAAEAKQALRARAAELREQIRALTATIREVHASAMTAAREGTAALTAERDQLRRTLAALDRRDRETATAVTETAAALAGAEQVRTGLGDPPAEVEALDAELTEELSRVRAQLAALTDAQARHRELAATVADIARREAEAIVYAALEDAAKRVRADEVGRQGGPLVEFLDRFLRAAGRSEAPYVRAERASTDFGWRSPGTAAEVSISALSGGEWVCLAAGLLAAISALRGAQVRPLLIEAAECDQRTLRQLLAGIAGVADAVTVAVVSTPHAPATVPAGWVAQTPAGEPVGELEAA